MKNLLILISCAILVSCGPSKEEIEAREKQRADSIALAETESAKIKQDSIETAKQEAAEQAKANPKHFSASDFNLIPGTVIDFAPTDDEISEWRVAGGDKADGVIYIHIQDATGLVLVKECDYRAWLNLHPGDILR